MQPKTGAALLALPIGGEFGCEFRTMADRLTYRVPTMPNMEAVFHEPDTVFFTRDADGQGWSLGCEDGRLCRVRTGL